MTATHPPATGLIRRGRIPALIAVAALIAALAVAPPWGRRPEVPAGSAGRLAFGQLEQLVAGDWTEVEVGDLVPAGATVRSEPGAQLAVEGGQISLASATRVQLAEPLVLEAGSLLVEVAGRERQVAFGAALAAGRGAWRVDAPIGRVGVYRGGVGVTLAGAGVALDRLQQVQVVSGQLSSEPRPLRYERDDPWDVRLLASAIAIDREVDQLSRSLVVRYGTAPRPLSFYERFAVVQGPVADALPRLAPQEAGGDTVGPPAEVLVAAIITQLLIEQAALAPPVAVAEVLDLRAAGATWGLIVVRHDLGADDLRAAVELAVVPPAGGTAAAGGEAPTRSRTPSDSGGPGGGGVDPADAGGGGGRDPSEQPPSEGGGGRGGGGDGGGARPTPTPSPQPSEPPAPGPCQLEPCEPVNETVDDLTDLIDEAAPGVGDTLDELVDEVPTLLPLPGL